MPEKYRYIRKCNPQPKGRKRVDRQGKKTLPSKLAWQRDYYKRNREAILNKRHDAVTNDPSIAVKLKQYKKELFLRHLLEERDARNARRKAA